MRADARRAARPSTMSSLDLVGDREQLVDADAVVVAGVPAEVAARAVHERRLFVVAAAALVERELLGRRRRTASTQCGQIRRTRRWPTTPSSDDAIRNGSMPMSRKRCSAGVASVACSDDRTKWPVSADCTAMRAVSTSRISPTRIDVGVLAQDRPQPVGERDAGLLVDLDLVDRREDVLDRVLDRHDVDRVVVDLGERRVERRRLARAGRARADTMPYGERMSSSNDSCVSVGHAELGELEEARASCRAAAARTSRRRSSTMVATRTSSVAAVDRRPRIWPSCGRRRSTMFMSAMILMRLHERRRPSTPGSVMSSCSAPSMRKRTRTRVVLRLDVDVGGAVAHRLGEDQVDDLDDGRVLVDFDHDRVGSSRRVASGASRHAPRSRGGRRRCRRSTCRSGRVPTRSRRRPRRPASPVLRAPR